MDDGAPSAVHADELTTPSPNKLHAVNGAPAMERLRLTFPGHERGLYLLAKRLLDIVLAGLALLLLSPLLLAIVLVLKIELGESVLFRQARIGRNGDRFSMYKFRTMQHDRRASARTIMFGDRRRRLKSERDPRVTRFGRLLRQTSLDELPQLLNVLRGEMSLVGPRPELPEMLRFYQAEHYCRHLMQPGLTGWWQVQSRARRRGEIDPLEDLEQKLGDDLYYIRHCSIGLDALILAKTIPVFLFRQGSF
jgi:lipopolysaccharide/colanic/teichoic acid biosynthesis glycosyltransferase